MVWIRTAVLWVAFDAIVSGQAQPGSDLSSRWRRSGPTSRVHQGHPRAGSGRNNYFQLPIRMNAPLAQPLDQIQLRRVSNKRVPER
jgi:hypothetical protein